MLLANKARAGNGVDRLISVSLDREKSIHAIEDEFANILSTTLRQSVPYQHERVIERQVRTMKNRYRCLLGDLRIPLTATLRKLAWEHSVKASNYVMNTNSGDYVPYQIQFRENSYRTPPRFGEFVVASVGKLENKEVPRRQVCSRGFRRNFARSFS